MSASQPFGPKLRRIHLEPGLLERGWPRHGSGMVNPRGAAQFTTTWRVGAAAGSSLIISSDPSEERSKLARPLAKSPASKRRAD